MSQSQATADRFPTKIDKIQDRCRWKQKLILISRMNTLITLIDFRDKEDVL